jgi:hypothetical protein
MRVLLTKAAGTAERWGRCGYYPSPGAAGSAARGRLRAKSRSYRQRPNPVLRPAPWCSPGRLPRRTAPCSSSLRRYFSTDLAIDLGTANTLIYVRDKGIVLDEPSVVAIRHEGGPQGKKTIQAVGKRGQGHAGQGARQHRGHPPHEGRRDRRLHRHRADAQAVHQDGPPAPSCKPSPRIIICVPCGSTQVERRAIRESALGAGASATST